MNKTAIKNFAVWARNKLIADISYRAGLMGITESGIAPALPQSTGTTEFYDIGTAEPFAISGDAVRQRQRLVELIERKAKETDYKTAYKYIIEEVAYTWFNRLIAIRFMEVNDYLPSHIRVLSSESGKMEPDLVTTPFDADLELSKEEEQMIVKLKQDNKLDELFRMLFIKQCNSLNELLPVLFEKTDDYTELLLNISIVDQEGIVYRLTHDIREEDFNINQEGQVEIIGWLYQFYNIEPKAEVFSKKGKFSKDEIPAVTQLFTPDWIVRYMVENSLGRLWIEGHQDSELINNWKYYLKDAKQETQVQIKLDKLHEEYKNLSIEEIRVIDPCMGSGHILVYCFDVLMQIYESQGYAQRDAAQCIIEKNLFGLDIDKRATQLAYFAVMMKARQFDRRFLTRKIRPNVYAIEESNGINRNQLQFFGVNFNASEREKANLQIVGLLDAMRDAKEYGSVLNIDDYDWSLLVRFINDVSCIGQISLETIDIEQTKSALLQLIYVGEALSKKYDVVITNPPYMSISAASNKLSNYVKENYPDSKVDLFAVFIEKCKEMLLPNRFQAMITMHSWMFLSSYDKLRSKMLMEDMINMAHLGARAFEEIGGEVVQTVAFVRRTSNIKNHNGTYVRLVDYPSQDSKEQAFLNHSDIFFTKQTGFSRIPGSPVAYWASGAILDAFKNGMPLGKLTVPRNGMKTGDNNKFLRTWWEVARNTINTTANSSEEAITSKAKWFPYNKGGEARKWYGNNEYIVNWENGGYAIFERAKIEKRNVQDYPSDMKFTPSGTWSLINTGVPTFRYKEHNLSDIAGMSFYRGKNKTKLYLGFCNTPVAAEMLELIAPTINYQAGDIARLPILQIDEENEQQVINVVDECIAHSRYEWDSFETSWDFEEHPFVRLSKGLWDVTATSAAMQYYYKERIIVSSPLELCYLLWQGECDERFNAIKKNEEQLNQLFIRIYGLEDELNSEVDTKNVTIRKADLSRDIRSFLSYAVGCMFGRYSLDKYGVVCAGENLDQNSYTKFVPDKDNCIPITDEEYFEDDIVGVLCKWLKIVFGADSLENNLDYIAKALGNKGTTSREVIRNYFVNDFFKDHCNTYSVTGSGKRPIYWLFDSGKNNGFKALVYMHRWDADTIGNLRVEYLHRVEKIYENEINRMQDMITHSTNTREVTAATKCKEKLQKQIKECREYDEKIGHLALSRIKINLDDGVKVNYEKVQVANDGKKYAVLAKI